MAEKGWIKLHRQLQQCPIWYGERFSKGQAWVDLLLLSNHSDKKTLFNGEIIFVGRGQYLTSMVKLAEKWGWNRKTVSSYLKMLEKDKMITKVSDNTKTLITIENYEVYQGTDEEMVNLLPNQTDNPADNPTDNPLDTNKNDKNDNNIYNNIYAQNSSCDKEREDKKSKNDELEKNFKIIYDSYPKKVGKARGFDLYKGWLKGREISGRKVKLTNKQMWNAISKYKREIENNGTELQYVKQFDTFMNKSILDYVEDEE